MKSIEKFVKSLRNKEKRFTGGLNEDVIENAEKRLHVSFASDYKELLSLYGSLSYNGEEILGVFADHYDVVMATEDVRRENSDFPDDLYVIENLGIDGVLIVQNEQGEVFVYQPGMPIQKESGSLCDYLSSL